MVILITLIHVIVCFFLIVVVLLQSGQRFGHAVVESHHARGGGVHDHVDYLVDHGAAQRGFIGQRAGAREGSGEDLGARQQGARSGSRAGQQEVAHWIGAGNCSNLSK